MSHTFKFPTFVEMNPVDENRRWLKYIREYCRYQLFYRLNATHCQKWVDFLNHNQLWIPLFEQKAYRSKVILNKFCDKRFDGRKRLEALIYHLQMMESILGRAFCQHLLDTQSIVLAHLNDGITLHFNVNQIDPFEGLFAFSLQDSTQRHLYDASFNFCHKNNY